MVKSVAPDQVVVRWYHRLLMRLPVNRTLMVHAAEVAVKEGLARGMVAGAGITGKRIRPRTIRRAMGQYDRKGRRKQERAVARD